MRGRVLPFAPRRECELAKALRRLFPQLSNPLQRVYVALVLHQLEEQKRNEREKGGAR